MHIWHLQTWQGLPYLTCDLLSEWKHGFFTQQFWSRTPADLVEILEPEADVYRVKQVHGNTVLSSSEIDGLRPAGGKRATEQGMVSGEDEDTDRPSFPDGDGLLTEASNQAIWVCTADCTPVLIADEATGQVAAVHAGWRGTALGIVQKTVERMLAQGSQLQQLRVAMGPAIAGEVYQVSTTVAAQVGATIVKQPAGVLASSLSELEQPTLIEPDEILEAVQQLPNSPVLKDPQPGRSRLDVRRVNALQLEQMGIQPEQIAIAPYCTYQNSDLFFSYRRERQKRVQWSGIVSKGRGDTRSA
jgi:YfiH family protein